MSIDQVMPSEQTAVATQPRGRYFYIDVWRGIAIVMMIVFHFSYDLAHFDFVDFDFQRDPFWLNFRLVIVSTFLCLVGVGLQMATMRGLNVRRYLFRLSLLIFSAAAVTLGSYFVFPEKVIVFGVLHFIVLASVLGLLFRHLYWSNLIFGIGLFLLAKNFQHEWFNQPAWHWIGLMTQNANSVDYVPVLPWFGIVLIGMFLARTIEKYGLLSATSSGNSKLVTVLALGGRHSLLIYLIHQPLFFGGFYLLMFFGGV